MKKTWKIGLLSSLLITPAVVVLVEQPVAASDTNELSEAEKQERIDRALTYFKSLDLSSSMTNVSFYMELLDKAFLEEAAKDPKEDSLDPRYALLKGKLDYIQLYNTQKSIADELKTLIPKLTLTNKNIVQSYDDAITKYKGLPTTLENLNTSLDAKKKAVKDEDEVYKNLLSNLSTLYDEEGNLKLVTKLVTEMVGSANENLLATRGVQVQNLLESEYAEKVLAISKATNSTTADTYKAEILVAKDAYAKLKPEEKTLADNQLVAGSTTVTLKQVMTAAEDNVAKAAAFDRNISSLSSIKFDTADAESIKALKTQLTAIDKAFNALTDFQKKLISEESEAIVTPFQDILTISGQIGALKPNNDESYRTAIEKIQENISNLLSEFKPIKIGQFEITKENVENIIPNIEVYVKATEDIKAVTDIEAEILDLMGTDEAPGNPTNEEIDNLRLAYNNLTTDQKKIVRNSSFITDQENAKKDAESVDKKIEAITISAKSDFYKRYKVAQDAIDKLDKSASIYVTKKGRLDILAPYAELVNKFTQLKVTDENYKEELADLIEVLNDLNSRADLTALLPEEKLQLDVVVKLLENQGDMTKLAADLVISIDQLQALAKEEPENLISMVVKYRATYNSLDSNTKKLVTNIKTLTEYEKSNKKALAVKKQVDNLDPLDNKFVKSAVAARKAYDKLSANLKPLIKTSFEKLEELEKISNVMLEIENLKKSRNILEDTGAAEKNYAELIEYLTKKGGQEDVIKVLEASYAPELVLAKNRHGAVSDLVNQINQLKLNFSPNVGVSIESIALSYKGLTSSDKKLVGNYKDFKNIEKNYKAAAKVIQLIEDLPVKESSDYTKKVEAALKAHLKLNSDQKKYVHNYETKLEPFIGVASLIGEIDQLKPSMKDFATIVDGLRANYDALPQAEKEQIHNYQKLVAAEAALQGSSKVIELIQKARPGVENYLNALQAARDAYDALNSDQKKQVTNYKELENREKAVKPVLSLNDLILKIGMQNSAKNFISNYEKAWKELDKISLQDRAILTNEKLLTETYVPLFNVMDRIESIKSSSKTFVEDVKAARAAYNALSTEQKAKILNVDLLNKHEDNVEGGAAVDELIRKLKSNPPAEYVQKVQEAEVKYKNLSSDNKKAVTLYDELKLELKYIAPVVQAIQEIDLLETSGGKLDAQVKKVNSILAKLTDEQYALIPNMAKYNNLGNVIQVVSLIELIKPSDTKYYIGNTKAAEIAYNRLSPTEKQKVTNYSKLEDALLNVAALDQITKKIGELSNLSSTYVYDVNHLLDEYKKLPSALKKQVSNYGKLQQAEKDVDAADKVIRAIIAIDPGVRTFESKVVSARKAYDKLTADQKTLVSNTRLLLQYERELGL